MEGAQAATHELLEAIGQLDRVELEKVARYVSKLRTRKGTGQSAKESELLKIARQRRPRTFTLRYRELIRKRQAETLTDTEYNELLQMTQETEAFETRRIKALTELSELRQTDLDTVMNELGLRNHA